MKLTIAPLATPSSITCASMKAIENAPKLFLQTAEHPSAAWILERGLAYEAMDALYEASDDFDALNRAVAAKLLSEEADAVYAVPGRGLGQAMKAVLGEEAASCGAELVFLPSPGYAEAAIATVASSVDAGNIRVLEASRLPCRIDPYVTLAIEEVDTFTRASEVKLGLLEYFPDEYPIFFCNMDNSGNYRAKELPLYELDREKDYFAASVVLVPSAKFDKLTRHGIEGLESVMERLRAPDGCPWDAEQTHESLKKSLIEESYEVLDAIDRADMDALCEELGDVLLQVVFHAELEREVGSFNMRDVATGIVNKLVYRHPHVFANTHVNNSADVLVNWENLKQKEKHQDTVADAMHAIPMGFPALMRAEKVQKKAAHVGFDWPDATGALDKVIEETAELREAIANGEGEARINEEAGDLLFAAVNAVRLARCDCELSLTAASDKFIRRFTDMEKLILARGLDMTKMPLDELDRFWDEAKRIKKDRNA